MIIIVTYYSRLRSQVHGPLPVPLHLWRHQLKLDISDNL